MRSNAHKDDEKFSANWEERFTQSNSLHCNLSLHACYENVSLHCDPVNGFLASVLSPQVI